MLYAVIWIGSFAAYALAMHVGASEDLARLILLVVLAETIISWAFAREMARQERDQLNGLARIRLDTVRQSPIQSNRPR